MTRGINCAPFNGLYFLDIDGVIVKFLAVNIWFITTLCHEACHLLHVHFLVDEPSVIVVPILVGPKLAITGPDASIVQPLSHLSWHDFIMLACNVKNRRCDIGYQIDCLPVIRQYKSFKVSKYAEKMICHVFNWSKCVLKNQSINFFHLFPWQGR